MELNFFTTFLSESMYLIVVFLFFFFFAAFRGRQSLINLIFGLYLALLISLEFPYYETIFGSSGGAGSESVIRLGLFVAFAALSTMLFARVMPDEFQEKKFESMGKKLLLSGAATVLVMIFSYHVLPVTEFITPGSPINTLFGNAEYFFWWLLVPLIVLYLL